jgi:hypothetical protein
MLILDMLQDRVEGNSSFSMSVSCMAIFLWLKFDFLLGVPFNVSLSAYQKQQCMYLNQIGCEKGTQIS